MSGFVNITYEGKHTVNEIQKRFREQLPEKEILKTTARALNETAKKVQGFIRKEVRKEYTVNNKYLDRMSSISKYAAGNSNALYAHVNFSYKPVPMIGFKHTGKPGQRKPISITVKKGKSATFRHTFIASLGSGHIGIFAPGSYNKGEFVYRNAQTSSGKTRITELKSASPFSMMHIKPMQAKIVEYVDKSLPSRLQYFLQKKLDKMNT